MKAGGPGNRVQDSSLPPNSMTNGINFHQFRTRHQRIQPPLFARACDTGRKRRDYEKSSLLLLAEGGK